MSNHTKLTGRKRYSIQRKKVVLQVEYTGLEASIGPEGIGDSDWFTAWRNATIEDLTVFTEPAKVELEVTQP